MFGYCFISLGCVCTSERVFFSPQEAIEEMSKDILFGSGVIFTIYNSDRNLDDWFSVYRFSAYRVGGR